MTREQALTMIIASIAMEELALSHILNAEGEKLQYILGTLSGCRPCADMQDVLAVNQSVAALLDVVLHNQMLLKSKLEKALEAAGCCCPPPCERPCDPPCPADCPCAKSVIRLTGQRDGFLWNKGCFMPWKCCGVQGEHIQWSEKTPAWVRLNPEKAYSVHLWLNVRGLRPGGESGTLFIRQAPLNSFLEPPPFCFSFPPADRETGRSGLCRRRLRR